MKRITSRDNDVFKSLRRLARSSRARRDENRIVLDGVHLVQAYLERFGPTGVVLVIRPAAAHHPEIDALAQRATSVMMTDSLFDQVTPVQSPMGLLGLAPLPEIAVHIGPGFQVLLDGVQDPGNLGAILRSAAAAGATVAHLSNKCADPWAPKSLRGGMGAQFLLPVCQHRDLTLHARTLGVRLIACTATGTISLFEADLTGAVGFVIGGEGAGISPDLLSQTEDQVRIPMANGIESLNAAQAATMCFYEWLRRAPGG
jgi:RNA methyltransferase, TrmH family